MILQLLVNGIIIGCGYGLAALGFGLIYSTSRTFHFAHGAMYTLSAYLFYNLYNLLDWPLVPALAVTVVLIAACGVILDHLVYVPLVNQGSSRLILLLSSLGAYIIIINSLALIYGNEIKVLRKGESRMTAIGGVILNDIQLAIIASFLALFGLLLIVLKTTRLGKQIRALRDDPALVSNMGINPQRVRGVVFALGSGLASVSAILRGLDVGIDPHAGMAVVLNSAVATIVGGVGLFEGAALGALLLGILQSLSVWKFSARWQDAVTFFILILFLLFRSQGIFGSRRRIEEVPT
jgi:branched-chain amino acid transport system permease protein